MTEKLIVCLTGMPGAGKSTIANGLSSKGFQVFNMGNVIRQEAEKKNLEPTSKNLGKLMLDLRTQNGPGAVAELLLDGINKSKSRVVVIDGIRSNSEIEVLKKVGNVKLLSIHASVNKRFDFLSERGRSDDPKNFGDFEERDDREINVGISNSIALADESLSNNNLTKEQLVESAISIIERWIKD